MSTWTDLPEKTRQNRLAWMRRKHYLASWEKRDKRRDGVSLDPGYNRYKLKKVIREEQEDLARPQRLKMKVVRRKNQFKMNEMTKADQLLKVIDRMVDRLIDDGMAYLELDLSNTVDTRAKQLRIVKESATVLKVLRDERERVLSAMLEAGGNKPGKEVSKEKVSMITEAREKAIQRMKAKGLTVDIDKGEVEENSK